VENASRRGHPVTAPFESHALFAIAAISRHIDGDRLWQRLMELARLGATTHGGVNRQALSDEEIAARALLTGWGRDLGLVPFNDPAANFFLRLRGRDDALPPVLVGSHIDSQPTGGKFDGALGVLAALEAIEAIRLAGVQLRRPIELVAWMNEEGCRFAPGMMGSATFVGARKLQDILEIRDADGITVGFALDRVLSAERDVATRPLGFKSAAFLELHIEQGPVLEAEGRTIGVVSGIQGKRTFRVRIDGQENHAGTSPRAARRDALVAAVHALNALHAAMWDHEDVVRFTVGIFTVSPNAPSVVPARVTFSIDLRHPEDATLRRLGDAITPICEKATAPCAASVTELLYDQPLEFTLQIRSLLGSIASKLQIPWMDIPSGAGHDARHLHAVCPTGMIFVPCKDGISHNEAESVLKEHAADGTRVLAEAVLDLAEAE
jgi:beta-ureidopropionase / N-carbamoyl-L-amino-acid hydrolase